MFLRIMDNQIPKISFKMWAQDGYAILCRQSRIHKRILEERILLLTVTSILTQWVSKGIPFGGVWGKAPKSLYVREV
jgi:hypothetical protein